MEKRIVIAGHRKRIISLFEAQIHSVLGKDLNILLAAEDVPIQLCLESNDILLITCRDVYMRYAGSIPVGAKVLIAETTLQVKGLQRLNVLDEGEHVLVVEDTLEKSTQLILNLIQFGITQLIMTPVDSSNPSVFKNQIVITSSVEENEISGAKKIIHLEPPLLGMTAILDLALELDRKELLTNTDIRASFLDFAPVHKGLSWALEKFNRFIGTEKVLIDIADGAIIGINQTGKVQICSEGVYSVLGIRPKDAMGKNGIQLFPQIPFQKVLIEQQGIYECLCVINDENMILTVQPVWNSGKRYGVVASVKRYQDEERRHNKLRTSLIGRGYRTKYHFRDIIGESTAMKQCITIAKRMAVSSSSILILGESGTGKEMFAQAIHNTSPRSDYQFVAVNCGAIPENLLESELFGYEEGAFTGAKKGGKPGLFELAHRGTLFLDEIAEMNLSLQKRLLRVLQEREVVRLGGNSVISIDVRIIAATNKDLRAMVQEGNFREDLYYRLSVLPLSIPPLRQRQEDIPLLCEFFRRQFSANFIFSNAVYEALRHHKWPGNVRELENYMEYFANLGVQEISMADLKTVLPTEIVWHSTEKVSAPSAHAESSFADERILFILRTLEEGFRLGHRLGRRSISSAACDAGIFLSEQEIRRLLIILQEKGLVKIYPTKAGTIITPKGISFLKDFS